MILPALLGLFTGLHATEQAMDVLIHKDSVFYIFSENLISSSRPIRGYPLETFIWREFNDTASWEVKTEMLKVYRWCQRGYIAKWEIRNDSLFLVKISYVPTVTAYVESKPADSFPLERLFPGRDVTNGVFADWFSDRIRTVTYPQTYPPYRDDYWAGRRKIFIIVEGLLLKSDFSVYGIKQKITIFAPLPRGNTVPILNLNG